MDFTVPNNATADIDLQLTRLVKDFHDGYLTEKGYIKKRMELLRSVPIAETGSQYSNSTSNTNSNTNTNTNTNSSSIKNPIYNNISRTSSNVQSDDFFNYSHTHSQSVDGSSTTQPVFYDDEILNKYNNMTNHYNPNIRKELQKPLDPRDISSHADTKYEFDNLAMILRKRAKLNEREPAVLIIDERGKESEVITWDKLYFRAEKIAKQVKNKAALYPGDRVGLIYQNVEVIDFMVAIYGCFLAGVVAVPLNSSIPTREMVTIMNDTQSHLCLMSDSVFKHFEKVSKQNKTSIWPKGMVVWKTSDMGTYKPSKKDGDPPLKVSDLAYIDYTRNTTGELKGVAISHKTVLNQMKMLEKILTSSSEMRAPLVRSTLKPSSSKNNYLSTLDVRNSIGMIFSLLFSVYSGNLLIWAYHKVAEVPGLLANVMSSYRTSVCLTDYYTLKSVVYNYQSFPQTTRTFNKRKVDLSSLKWCLIDAITVDCEFNEILSDRWLKPLGNKYPKKTISPLLSLNEQGGAIVSMRDWYGNEEQLGCVFNKNENVDELDEFADDNTMDRLSEILIDKESLSTNSVKVINDSPKLQSSSDSNLKSTSYIRVGAFGYPLPDSTLAIVNPETKILSGVFEVGEIWIDSNCISGGYWGLPDDTETVFQAECSDYEGILSLKFVRTGYLGFIYNGQVYVLGLYEDRINQRVTWYDQYLEFSNDEKDKDKEKKDELTKSHSRNISVTSDLESYYKMQRKRNAHNLDKIDLTQNLSNKYIYKYHYSNHLVKTLARFIPYFKDCAFFNIKVNKEYLPVGVMELELASDTSRATEVEVQSTVTEAFNVLEKHHNIRPFFLIVTKTGSLSRSLKSGRVEIANTLTKRRFLEGRLPSVYVSFKPYNSLGSVYHGEDLIGGIWSPYCTSIRSEILSYADYQSSGLDSRDSSVDYRSHANLSDFKSPVELLEFRSSKQSDELAFAQVEGLVIKENKQLTTWSKFENKVFTICSYILEKKILSAGDVVILMYPLCEEYISCLYACWMAGFVVIPMQPIGKDMQTLNEDVETLVKIVKEYKVQAIFVNNESELSMKGKQVTSQIKFLSTRLGIIFPKLRNTSKHSKTSSSGKSTYKKMEQYRKQRKSSKSFLSSTCMLWLNLSSDNDYTAYQLSSKKIMDMCLSLKETCQMSGNSPIVGCSDHSFGLGFLFGSVLGLYLGTTTYLMTYEEYKLHTKNFYQIIERYKIENVYISHKLFVYALSKNSLVKTDLKNLKNLMISYDNDRADALLHVKYKDKLLLSNIKPKNISHVYNHPMNPLISTRSFLSFEPTILWLDPHALSQGYISIVNPKDSPSAIPVVDSGVVSVNTEVIIVNPQTEKVCKIGEFGEIWVSSNSTVDDFAGKDNNPDNKEFLKGQLEFNQKQYLRTGDFGFLHTVNQTDKTRMIELQLLYNIGKIDETFEYCGLNYFAKDIEHCMETFDGISKCCVFKAGEYTVLIASTSTSRSLSTITPLMILKLLNKFKIVVDIVSFVESTGILVSRNGMIKRRTLAEKWLKGTLNIKKSFGVSYGEAEMVKAIKMQEWVEDKLTK